MDICDRRRRRRGRGDKIVKGKIIDGKDNYDYVCKLHIYLQLKWTCEFLWFLCLGNL